MTMLAFDLEEKPRDGSFAGFTVFYINPKGERNPIQNLLNFTGSTEITGSDVSPIQLFKWVHFPGSYHQNGSLIGKYRYEATPRYFDHRGNLMPLESSYTATVEIDVKDFSDGNCRVGFTRAFLKSQAFAKRYGSTTKLLPSGDWVFNTNQKAGTSPQYGDFSFEDMYAWLGFNARKMAYEMLQEGLQGGAEVTVDMFAYDFNDPVMASMCFDLASQGRIRIILDNATLHHGKDKKTGKTPKEDDFEKRFNSKKKGNSEMYRCRFGRYAHCKEIILRKNGVAYKVLTGSTNFSYTGLYINANHVLVFDDSKVAGYYAAVFDACWKKGTAAAFKKTDFSRKSKKFTDNVPETEINVSPHDSQYAKTLLDDITAHVKDKKTSSVLFSVMDIGKNSSGDLIPTLRELHKDDSIFTYGVTDNSSGEVSLYKPGQKHGLLVNAKAASRELPPPFLKEHTLGSAHAIHHKFVVTNFNKKDARVYCGSSNLALGGETQNGDNLLCIRDTDVATVFAIEALRLTDHYNFRSLDGSPKLKKKSSGKKEKLKPITLDLSGTWVRKFFDKNDIRNLERETFA